MKSSSGGLAHQDHDRPRIGALALSLANEVWTTSASAVQIAYDAGLRDAEIEAAPAVYRQRVLMGWTPPRGGRARAVAA
ncbi:MAG: hypothetical protein ACLQFI_19715 [Methylocella sp.]